MNRGIKLTGKKSYDTLAGGDEDSYSDILVKMIPVEMIFGFLAISSLLESSDASNALQLILFYFAVGSLTLLTPFYLHRQIRRGDQTPLARQLVFSTLGFLVWVYSIGGILRETTFWHPAIAGVGVIIFTLSVPIMVDSTVIKR
jgi:hypothetical protein